MTSSHHVSQSFQAMHYAYLVVDELGLDIHIYQPCIIRVTPDGDLLALPGPKVLAHESVMGHSVSLGNQNKISSA